MYIKQVIISGFKSYKDRLEVDPFSPRHNLIVGRNGSGKSNFFDAIAFVLSDRFANMRTEHRKKLLHESGLTGSNVMNAYVEIVFDNADGRLPVDRKEVVLRRTIGAKKDEFFLDRRHISKSDVTALLESAGFSRSNPYYIVMQGKVNKLCHMKDRERLDLLKEVAGTSVYEKRRAESRKIMRDTDARRVKINEVIEYIEKRLSELEKEKEELSEYQRLDKQRRALEYALYAVDFRDAGERLEQIKELREEESEKANALHLELTKTEATIESLDAASRTEERALSSFADEIESREEEFTSVLQARTACELEIATLNDQVVSIESTHERLRRERTEVLAPQIEAARTELSETVEPRRKTVGSQLERARAKFKEASLEIECLYEKLGRSKVFASATERDAWIRSELETARRESDTARRHVRDGERDVESLEAQLKAARSELTSMKTARKENEAACRRVAATARETRARRNETIEERRTYWKRAQETNRERQRVEDELQSAKRAQSKSCPRNLLDGIAAARRVAKERGLKGMRGPLIENVRCRSDKMLIPVEATVGNQLFNVIVDTEATAAELMKALAKEKAGRVTFMPVDVIEPIRRDAPKTQDAFPLLSKLEYDESLFGIMSRVFGKTLVCRNRQTASTFSREGWTCVTLDGEVFNAKGNMSGGYYDMGLSRMRSHKRLRAAREELVKIEARAESISKRLADLDQEDAASLGEISRLEIESTRARSEIERHRTESERQESLVTTLKRSLDESTSNLTGLRETLSASVARETRLRDEMGTALVSSSNDAEVRARLEELRRTLEKDLKPSVRRLESELSRLEQSESALRSKLEDDLERRAADLAKSLDDDGLEERRASLRERRELLSRLKREESDLQTRLSRSRAERSSAGSAARERRERAETARADAAALRDALQEHAKQMEKLLNKRHLLFEKRDAAKRKIAELGSLPDEEVKTYRGRARKELVRELRTRGARLKRYAHVNKKALAQFLSFSEQREELLMRKRQLDEGHDAIVELIDALDLRKDEAIGRTFDDVAKHFEDVFKELVPRGHGRLVMKTDVDDDEDVAESKGGVSRFTGVGVDVSFSEGRSVNQLSGGQKSLVALAIIFAIQRCDPAPFYVFDEIDQALDSTHRAAVAALIRRQADAEDGAVQFITSTFWPEQVDVATQFYGVALQHKVSEIHRMKKDEAARFVREVNAEERRAA